MDDDADTPTSPQADGESTNSRAPSLQELISAEAFKLLQPKLPEGSKQRSIQLTKRDESNIKEHVVKDLRSLALLLAAFIGRTYDEIPYKGDMAKKVAERFERALRHNSPHYAALSDPLLEKLEHAFIETKYRGTAHLRLRAYVERSWGAYRLHPDDFKAPYVAIAQSSGTGKSRGVQELAQVTSKEKGGSMGVLYMCTRHKESTGYPKATPKLQEWLFDEHQPNDTPLKVLEDSLVNHLVTIYIYAQKHWKGGRATWLAMFQKSVDLDKRLARKLAKLERRLCKEPEWWKTNCEKFTKNGTMSKRLLILAVDEAGILL